MKKEDIEMVEQLLKKDNLGLAYLYPSSREPRKEFMFEMTAENIANFIGSHFYDAKKIILTDMVDRLILDTTGGFIDRCPNQLLCAEIVSFLAPIQMGEYEAEDFLMSDRLLIEEYYALRNTGDMETEMSML